MEKQETLTTNTALVVPSTALTKGHRLKTASLLVYYGDVLDIERAKVASLKTIAEQLARQNKLNEERNAILSEINKKMK